MNEAVKRLKAKIDTMDIVMSIIVILFGVLIVLKLIFMIHALFLDKTNFTIIGNEVIVQSKLLGELSMYIRSGALKEGASAIPKTIYLLTYIKSLIENIFIFLILYNVKSILKNIRVNNTPFYAPAVSKLKFISILLLVYPTLNSFFLQLGYMIFGTGTNNLVVYDNRGVVFIIIAALVGVLAYIFKYGLTLQTEADETL